MSSLELAKVCRVCDILAPLLDVPLKGALQALSFGDLPGTGTMWPCGFDMDPKSRISSSVGGLSIYCTATWSLGE